MTHSKTDAPWQAKRTPPDAIALLRADHDAVRRLFAAYEATRSTSIKKALVAEICTALSVHAQVKEEIFYPEVRTALKDATPARQATIERAGVMYLIAQLQGVEPHGDTYDAVVKVLSEYVKHHVHEEQNEMFPRFNASSMDMIDVGARMAARQDDLMAQAA